MTKWYPRDERVAFLAAIRATGELFPGRCIICRAPGAQARRLLLADFMRGEYAQGVDAEFECPMCEQCLQQCLKATDAMLTQKGPLS